MFINDKLNKVEPFWEKITYYNESITDKHIQKIEKHLEWIENVFNLKTNDLLSNLH